MRNKRLTFYYSLTILIILISAAVFIGSVFISPINLSETGSLILWQIRLPRVLLAALVGAMLAVSGAALQAVLRNPLADPYILGVSAGGSLGAAAAMILSLPFLLVSPIAFICAMICVLFIYQLSKIGGRVRPSTLILAGVAVSSFVGAILGFLMITSNKLQSVYFWILGSFQYAVWESVGAASLYALIGISIIYVFYKQLNVLMLSEEEALSLGVDVPKIRLIILSAASLLAAVAASLAGMIGFVGLLVPHMIRMFAPDHKYLIPLSMVAGACLMVFADLIARVIIFPSEIPVGIVTAVLGAPFFIWLLRKGRGIQ